MDINQILDKYDTMFGGCSLEQIDAFLEQNIEEALEEGDVSSIITLVNEMIGFCRDTSKVEKGMGYCSQLITLMRDLEMEGTVPYATSILNIGNAYRAFGHLEDAMECYQTVEVIYDQDLDPYDFRFASLYNNWSLLYQEMGEFEYAKKSLYKALAIVTLYEEAKIEQATTHTNLAVTLMHLKEMEEAQKHLSQGLAIYEEDGGRDFHYSAALAAAGDACYLSGRQQDAIYYYSRAMEELEQNVGRTEAYKRVAANRLKAKEALKLQEEERKQELKLQKEKQEQKNEQNRREKVTKEEQEKIENQDTAEEQEELKKVGLYLTKCKEFYETYGAPMIHTRFPEYEQQIAVGLVGEGSECFGYDDNLSVDHDYELGFCLWIPEELNWTIGEELQKAYEELLEKYTAKDTAKENAQDRQDAQQKKKRRGVRTIHEFYRYFLAQSKIPEQIENWIQISDGALAAATNGEVFRDDAGIFSAIRKKLKEYYPEEVFRYRLAEELTYFSQYGQYNYPRMMARKDYVTAKISLAEWMVHTMRIVYLLNRTYEPYYKWLRKGITYLPLLPEIGDILDAVADMPDQREAWKDVVYCAEEVNGADSIALTIEIVARYLLAELQRQELVEEDTTYLASHAKDILLGGKKILKAGRTKEEFQAWKKEKGEHLDLVSRIVHFEWQQFQEIENEGKRAECQEDWKTFQIMRKSQYLTWSRELLICYLEDLLTAKQNGCNLIMEKYARMMESTAPEEYEKWKVLLPERDMGRIVLQEEVIKIQVAWMEEFAKKYPYMAKNSRKIHTTEDTLWETSYETYLRGELGTYSDQTLETYGRFIVELARRNLNLAYLIMENTAEFYGYESVEEAEYALKKKQ